MTKGQIADAERRALTQFDKWNDITGALSEGSSWYYECQAVIEEAVHIGIQMALYGGVSYDKDGNVIKKSK